MLPRLLLLQAAIWHRRRARLGGLPRLRAATSPAPACHHLAQLSAPRSCVAPCGIVVSSLYGGGVQEVWQIWLLQVLSDPEMRIMYDEINGYAASATNPFLSSDQERDHAFVDEFVCIGCKNCSNTAENTFEMEALFGRARVASQFVDHPSLLTLLEDEMRRIERVSVAVMLAGQGSKGADVFAQAKARERLMKEKVKKKAAWESVVWGRAAPREEAPPGGAEQRYYNSEKAARAAAAARRWREYSRSGVDRRAVRYIGVAAAEQEEAEAAQETVV
eukprot:jgi/Mesen1/5064/ME000252S04178